MKTKTITDYNRNATYYESFRKPSLKLVKILRELFNETLKQHEVLSIGCGTGQYEYEAFKGKPIVGLDLSEGMIKIAKTKISEVVKGNMQDMPFNNRRFHGVYFMQSFHHLGANFNISSKERTFARQMAINEAHRVLHSGNIAIIQRDPIQNQAVWFWKYFPEALQKKLIIQPTILEVIEYLQNAGFSNIEKIPIHDKMIKGFWEPTAPLDNGFRKSFSEFSYLDDVQVTRGIKLLSKDIESGQVKKEIELSKEKFQKIGGTVFIVKGIKK